MVGMRFLHKYQCSTTRILDTLKDYSVNDVMVGKIERVEK